MEFSNKIKGLSISGRAVKTLSELLGNSKAEAMKIFKFHKISDSLSLDEFIINPDEWYNLDRFLLALKDIQDKVGEEKIKEVAYTTILYAPLHPSIIDIQTAMKGLNRAYYLNISKDGLNPIFDELTGKFTKEAGEFLIEIIPNINKILCTSTSCFPTSYELGLLEGFAKKFQACAKVKLDEQKPTKKKSYDSNTYIITW